MSSRAQSRIRWHYLEALQRDLGTPQAEFQVSPRLPFDFASLRSEGQSECTSYFICMRDLHEEVFECRFALRKLAHRPMALTRQPENLRPDVGASFGAERKDL